MKDLNPVYPVILSKKDNTFDAVLPVLIFLSICIFLSNGFTQSHIAFNHLTIQDGLSQSSVTCIFQDKKGFMWFGTQDGLNRYDGYNFKVFKNDPADSTSLTDNFIFSIYEDRSGSLYIETQSQTLHKYNPLTESFIVLNKDSVQLEHMQMSTIAAVLHESSGVTWKGGLGKNIGLVRTDSKTGQKTVFKHDPMEPASISDDRVYSIMRDRYGILWIGTYNGLDRFDEKSGEFYHYRHNPDDPNSLPDNWVWPIFEDSRGMMWIGTVNGGLAQFDRQTGQFVNYRNDPNDPTSINSNYIFAIYEDRSSVIWIGTNLGGINYFHPSTNDFEHYKSDPGNTNSLSDNLVSTMLVDRNGIYWIGTNKGGLNRFDYQRKKFKRFLHDPNNLNSFTSNSIQSLLEDRSGILWVGTFSKGLNAFNRKTGQITRYNHDPDNPLSLSDDRIYALDEDENGDIWIGTYQGGLNKLDKKTGKIIRYQHNENDPTSISSNLAWSVLIDQSGNLWIGTFGGGVNLMDRDKNNFRHFKHDASDSTSIGDNNVIRTFQDSKGDMWFGTTKGLSRYSFKSGKFNNYDENDGLANSYVFAIVEDHHGHLWLSTNDGLSRFNPESEVFRNYYIKDGLQGNEFNQNAYANDPLTGNILFGGPNGFNVFHPDSLQENSFLPPIQFTGYLRYNTDDEEGKPIIEKGISERDSIALTYKDNIINLQFAALSYFNNPENQYRYKLEGFNDNWIQLGHTHQVTFTNLSAGEYTLRVMGSNNDGLWNEEGKSLLIEVFPPWWRTNTAYLLYFLGFFGLLYGIRRYEINRRDQKAQIRESALRIKATEAEKRALEIENERKTKELEEARQLQLSMLPKELPNMDNLEIAAFMRTATEVGGDYYDFMVQDDGVLNVAFGDATGHGLQAGTMVTLMKGFFTSDSANLGLQEFMSHCTRIIKDIKLGRILMSFTYMKIVGQKLQITSGGMPPVYYHSKRSNHIEEIIIQGTPLGAMRNAIYQTTEKTLEKGDTILLLTDGLPEQMNQKDEMLDYPRVKQYFSEFVKLAPQQIIEKLVDTGDRWMNGRIQDDDITMVVIRIK